MRGAIQSLFRLTMHSTNTFVQDRPDTYLPRTLSADTRERRGKALSTTVNGSSLQTELMRCEGTALPSPS